MIDRVRGSTVRIKFTTVDKANGAPVAPSSAFAASDFRIYKDGSATEKTSTNGITVTSPVDSVVGRHMIEIDTSNETGDSGFWAAGSEYWIEINSAKTVDSSSQSGVEVGRFRLTNGSNGLSLLETTIATLASQTSFTLTDGSADNSAYNDLMIVVTDAATRTQKAWGWVSAYTGSTKTVTLVSDPGIFTMAVGDYVTILAVNRSVNVSHFGGNAGTFSGGRPEVNTTHAAGVAWGSGAITAASLAADCITAAKIATGAIDSDALAASAVTAIQSGLATAANLTLVQTDLTTLLGRLTSARAGYLDNLNVGGAVASQADINAINQSASRRIILTSVGQYERPESGSTVYTIEARTYDGDGAAVNADSTPTLTVTGQTSGSLAANLSAATNPSTGLYRWTYTVTSAATLEPARADISAVIGGSTFTLSLYTQIVDFVAATWTTTHASQLAAIFNKLPSRSYLTGSNVSTGVLDGPEIRGYLGLASADLDDQLLFITDQGVDTHADLAAISTKIGTPAGASVSADIAAVKSDTGTLVSRITSTLFSGITYLSRWLGAIAGKTADTATRAEINATTAGATYLETTDSLEAIRDRGDAAWTTGAGGGGGGGGTVSEAVVVARVAIGATVGWPKTLIIGDARLATLNTAPKLFIKDIDDNILTSLGTKTFTDGDFRCALRLSPLTDDTRDLSEPPATIEVLSTDSPGITFDDSTPGSEFFNLQIPHAKSALGVIRTEYLAEFIMNWGADSTYESTINLGNVTFIRKAAAPA